MSCRFITGLLFIDCLALMLLIKAIDGDVDEMICIADEDEEISGGASSFPVKSSKQEQLAEEQQHGCGEGVKTLGKKLTSQSKV